MPRIDALLNPKSVAVIGASPEVHKLRGLIIEIMNSHPYEGTIYPVSRSHDEVQGLKAYATVSDLPETVDLAVLIIPSQFVLDTLKDCGKAGISAALIMTSGFAEQASGDGKEMQTRIKEIAAQYDMAVLGPNSEGFTNTALSLAPTFSPAMNAPEKPLLPVWHKEGRIAVISQSGAVGFSFFDLGREKELPFRYVVTTGNEGCLEVCDLVDFMLDEDKTDVFILFLEDIKTADKFRAVAAKALGLGKPIIVAKIGSSDAAARATVSHTGALAGSYASYMAMFEHYGLVVGESAEQMVDLAMAFLCNIDRLPEGRRIGISTGSGGAGAWMADSCADQGLEVPQLDEKARAKIDPYLPPYGTSQNPVDGTAQAIREIGYSSLATLVSEADNVDAVIMVASTRKKRGFERERENFMKMGAELPKPILNWSYTLPHETSLELLAEAGVPLITNMRHVARCMAALANYREVRERFLISGEGKQEPHKNRARAIDALRESGPVLCEYEARRLLVSYGIGDNPGDPVVDAAGAVDAARVAGGPVALKIQSADIPHKSDSDALMLNVQGDEDVRAAFDQVMANAKSHAPSADISGVLVEPMAKAGVEVVLGIDRDDTFGPMLMVGLGGVHVEVLQDVVLAPVPITADAALSLINRLKGAKIFEGVRGAPEADTAALADTMVALSEFAADLAGEISEIDLNPVIVHKRGEGVSVVDALIIRNENV